MVAEIRRYKIADLIAEGILAINDGYRAKNEELGADGLPFARAGNIDGGFNFEGADRFPEDELDNVGSKVSRPGDVVFTSKGTVGRIAFVRGDTVRFVYSPQLCYWRVLKPQYIEPRFLYYWMLEREFHDQLNAVKGQTDMADYVSLQDQRAMFITLPELSRQLEVVSVLSLLDDKIDLNRRVDQTLESIARALFKSWLVDLNSIPEGWVVVALDSVAEFLNGLAMQRFPPQNGEDTLPVIKIAELRRGDTASSDRAGMNVPAEYIIDDRDVIFSWSGSLEVMVWTGGRGALNQHIFKVTSREYPKWFFLHWIKEHLPTFRAIAADKATTMGHIQRRHLTEALVVVPSPGILAEMDSIMAPLLEKQIQNSLESRTLAALRDTLLPKLLSGEICVKQAEKIVEKVA